MVERVPVALRIRRDETVRRAAISKGPMTCAKLLFVSGGWDFSILTGFRESRLELDLVSQSQSGILLITKIVLKLKSFPLKHDIVLQWNE